MSRVLSLAVTQPHLLNIHEDDHFLLSDTDWAAGFEETAERSASIAHVANDFAGHLRVVVAFPSHSGKYRTTCNFPERNGSVSQDFTF
jgi:hypothetical protein